MNFKKTAFFSFLSSAIKILSTLIINKVLAFTTGASGLAIFGQFQNFVHIALISSQGGINDGVVKYSSQLKTNESKLSIFKGTAMKITVASSLTVLGLILIFLDDLNRMIFLNLDYKFVFIILSLTILLFALNNLLLGILNGFKEIKMWAYLNILQSIFSMLYSVLLIYLFGIQGALIALATNQSFIFLIAIFYLRKKQILTIENFKEKFDLQLAKKLSGYAAMTFASVLTVPLSLIIIRTNSINTIGLEDTGFWQAIWFISTAFTTVVTSMTYVYFFPRLSEITQRKHVLNEIRLFLKTVIPIIVFLSLCLYFLRDFVIIILYNQDFLIIGEFILYQLIGDFFRIISVFLSYLIIINEQFKTIVLRSIFNQTFFVLTSYFLLTDYGIMGILYAYISTYILNFSILLFLNHKLINGDKYT